MTYTLEELKEYINAHFDPDELIELLDINTEQLVEAFEDLIIEKRYKFDEEETDELI